MRSTSSGPTVGLPLVYVVVQSYTSTQVPNPRKGPPPAANEGCTTAPRGTVVRTVAWATGLVVTGTFNFTAALVLTALAATTARVVAGVVLAVVAGAGG